MERTLELSDGELGEIAVKCTKLGHEHFNVTVGLDVS